MNATDIKKELHEYIEEADERLLNLIYGMVIVDKQSSSYTIPDWHGKLLEERAEEYERNPENVINWEDLKAKIENMK